MLIRNWRPLLWLDPEPQGGGTPPPAPPPTGAAPPPAEDKKFTQADVDRLLGDRAKRAEETATARLLESLGVKTPDELKTALETLKKIEDEKKSDLEKAQAEITKHKDAADKAKADAELALTKANERLMQSAVLLEAQKAGVEDAEIKSVWRELRDTPALMEKVKQNDAGEFEGAAEVVKEIVKAHPKWLKATVKSPGTPPSKPNNAPPAKPNEQPPRRIGAEF